MCARRQMLCVERHGDFEFTARYAFETVKYCRGSMTYQGSCPSVQQHAGQIRFPKFVVDKVWIG